MKFKQPRQNNHHEITDLIAREIRRQKLVVLRAPKKKLLEIIKVSKAIKKNGLPSYLVRKKLPKNLGYGIFLHPKAKPILKGQMIAPYAGELSVVLQNKSDDSVYAFTLINDMRLTKEEQSALKFRYHPRRLFSLNLDAHKKGNFTRFINHSDKPNINAYLYSVPPNPFGLTPSLIEVFYLANKMIHPGEQLLNTYEDEEKTYWGSLKIKPFPMTPKTFQLSSELKIVSKIA